MPTTLVLFDEMEDAPEDAAHQASWGPGPRLLCDHCWNRSPSLVLRPALAAKGSPQAFTIEGMGIAPPAPGKKTGSARKGRFFPYTQVEQDGSQTFHMNQVTKTVYTTLFALLRGVDPTQANILGQNTAKFLTRGACIGFLQGRDFLLLSLVARNRHDAFDLFSQNGFLEGWAPPGWPDVGLQGMANAAAPTDLDRHRVLMGHVFAPKGESGHARLARHQRIGEDLALLSSLWAWQTDGAYTATMAALSAGNSLPVLVHPPLPPQGPHRFFLAPLAQKALA